MSNLQVLEQIANELVETFGITMPPIPIESMLQHPKPDMWEDLDISQLSGSFLRVTEHYSPRMSLARLLARQLVASRWGQERNLSANLQDEETLHRFARMIVMPAPMVLELSTAARTPPLLSAHFEVPEEDARLRLTELEATK